MTRSLGGSFRTQVLLDKVGKRDDDFRCQHGYHHDCPESLELEQAEREEKHGIGEVASAVKLELAALRDSPGQPFHHFMMVEDVEQAERELNGDQGPKQ